MSNFETIYMNGRYLTFNKKRKAIDFLWYNHQCLNCCAKLPYGLRTFCVRCRKKMIRKDIVD